jgi:hypothetical protein
MEEHDMPALPDAVLWRRIVYELFTMRHIEDREAKEIREEVVRHNDRAALTRVKPLVFGYVWKK